MKTLKMSQVIRDAAEIGASVGMGDRVINASGTKLSLLPGQAAKVSEDDGGALGKLAERMAELLAAQTRAVSMQSEAVVRVVDQVLDKLQAQQPQQVAAPAVTAADALAPFALSPALDAPPLPAVRRMPVAFDVESGPGGEPLRLIPTYGEAPAGASRPISFELVKDNQGATVRVVPIYQE